MDGKGKKKINAIDRSNEQKSEKVKPTENRLIHVGYLYFHIFKYIKRTMYVCYQNILITIIIIYFSTVRQLCFFTGWV